MRSRKLRDCPICRGISPPESVGIAILLRMLLEQNGNIRRLGLAKSNGLCASANKIIPPPPISEGKRRRVKDCAPPELAKAGFRMRKQRIWAALHQELRKSIELDDIRPRQGNDFFVRKRACPVVSNKRSVIAIDVSRKELENTNTELVAYRKRHQDTRAKDNERPLAHRRTEGFEDRAIPVEGLANISRGRARF